MTKTKIGRKTLYCYVSWFIILVFSILTLLMSRTCEWGNWVNIYLFVTLLITTVITWSQKFGEGIQSYCVLFVAMGDMFVYTYMKEELYPTIIVICSLAILLAIYMQKRLLLVQILLSAILVFCHAFLWKTFHLTTAEEIVQCFIRIGCMFFAEGFLTYFVHRLCNIEENLKITAAEARKAERSKADFLANMSHEIRTPMNAIVGMCELILRDDINENVRENCFNIQNSGRSLLSIINDILDFSKIESGKVELVEEEFNIGSTINDVLNMAMTRKGDKKIDIIARVDSTIPKGLIGDEVRIRQVIINLVTNAIKFTHTGCVVIKVGKNSHEYGINLTVTVYDTGIGISEENLEKLFTSFQQVDTKKNRSVEGTGLGLAISKRLVAQMGGFINVDSIYGEGSRFKIVIPLKVADSEPFISVKDADSKKVAVHINMNKYPHPRLAKEYSQLIRELKRRFQLQIDVFQNFEELKEELFKGEYNYCFTAKEEYLANREALEQIADELQLVVIQDRINAIELPDKVKCIYKPFYALSVATVLNNEKYTFNINDRRDSAIRFTAPDAKILIVDDNEINLKVAVGLMKPYNMRIITAESGPAAIEALKKQDYNLVFMDHMMPEMDGVEATAIIRRTEGDYYKKVPIIALTANAISGAREMYMENGFNDFIAKPIELTTLDRVLRAWLPQELMKSASQMAESEETKVEMKSGQFINYEKGFMYAGKDQEVYSDNLALFVKNGKKYQDSLNVRFADGDWSNYVIEVHALKGFALSIGAESLSEQAKTLEFAGKEEKYDLIKENHRPLLTLYDKVIREAEEYLGARGYIWQTENAKVVDAGNLKAITLEELESYMGKIRNGCDNFDGDEIARLAAELCDYRLGKTPLHTYFEEVKKLAEDFEYDGALEMAEKAAKEIKGV